MSDLVERLRSYSDQLGGITDEAADEIQRLKVKIENQASFIKEFHSCLNGIDEIRCIPGASIDNCWDAKSIRAVVDVLGANCLRTWKDNWRGREKESGDNARLHNEACDSESQARRQKTCNHQVSHDQDDSAICVTCGCDLGWYCYISPKSYCEYTDDECCIHCGAPEERQ